MIIAGLTGSIGMGKSTTTAMFASRGVPVWDADAAVHRLYAQGGAAVEPIKQAFPDSVRNEAVDRERLSADVLTSAEALKKLENIVHPLVGQDRQAFLETERTRGAPLVILDIPLLFENGGNKHVDIVIVVSAPADIQRRRVLARPGMTSAKFDAILARQTPDAIKRAGADFIIDTHLGIDVAREHVETIHEALCTRAAALALGNSTTP